MKIEYVDIEKLVPDPDNARKHDDKNIKSIAGSIKKFDVVEPLIVRRENNVVIGGNGRLQVLKNLGYKEVPVNYVDFDAVKSKALSLALNRTSELAVWDDDILGKQLQALYEDGFEIEDIGFDMGEFDIDTPESKAQDETEDEVPEVPQNVRGVKLGDIWQLGEHRVICADSTVKENIEKLMDGQKADMVFTDPPYGVSYQSNMRTQTAQFDVLKNDDVFLNFCPIVDNFSSGWVFIWTSWKVLNKWINVFSSLGYPTNMIIWHKPGGGIGDLKRTFSSDYEVALVWHRSAEICGKRIGSVWTINKDGSGNYLHPTQKPVALAVEAIDNTTLSQSIVLDLFLGSGSTLIACEKTGRKCFGAELDPHYVSVIIERWEKYSGKKAVLLPKK